MSVQKSQITDLLAPTTMKSVFPDIHRPVRLALPHTSTRERLL